MVLRELGERVEARYRTEIEKAEKKLKWLKGRVGAGNGVNQTYVYPTDGNRLEFSDPEENAIGRFVAYLENEVRKTAGTEVGHMRDPRAIALDPLYNKIRNRKLTQSEYNSIALETHPAVSAAIDFVEEKSEYRPPSRWTLQTVEGDQLASRATNPVESRPSFLFPDAEDYKIEMRMLRRDIQERYGGS